MNSPLKFGICYLFIVASSLHAQDATVQQDSTGDAIVSGLDRELAALSNAYRQKVALLDSAYIERVKSLREAAAIKLAELQKKVAPIDLDEAIRLRNISRDILAHSSEPPSRNEVDAKVSNVAKADTSAGGLPNTERTPDPSPVSEPEQQLGSPSELTKKITGASYRIQLTNGLRVWTFNPNGALLVDGKATEARWGAFGKDAIICVFLYNGYIDICHFSNDFLKIDVTSVGNYKHSQTHHLGTLVTQ